MTTTNMTYVIPMLALVMLIPMGSIGAFAAPAGDAPTGNAEPADMDELTAYEEFVLDNMPNLDEATEQDKASYIKAFRDSTDGLTEYESSYMDKLEELAEAQKKLDLAKAANETENVAKYESEKALRIFELEDLGVTTKDRFDASPGYWTNKAINAAEYGKDAGSTSITNNDVRDNPDPDLETSPEYVMEPEYISLSRIAVITYPCWEDGIVCPLIENSWNEGTSASEIGLVPVEGQLSFRSAVCLEGPAERGNVGFKMRIQHDLYDSSGTIYTADESSDRTLANMGDCHISTTDKDANAGHGAKIAVSITDIAYV